MSQPTAPATVVCRTCGRPAYITGGGHRAHVSPDATNHAVDGPIVYRPEAHPVSYGRPNGPAFTPRVDSSDGRAADRAAELDARRHF